eukprot:1375584-Rhodomonas_salina.1
MKTVSGVRKELLVQLRKTDDARSALLGRGTTDVASENWRALPVCDMATQLSVLPETRPSTTLSNRCSFFFHSCPRAPCFS